MSAQTPMLQQASLLSGRQMIMLAIIAMHGLFISALMAMRVMPDAQPQAPDMIATIDPVRDVPPPPPPEIPVTIAQPKTTAVPMIKPEIIIPEKETVVADIGPAEVEPVQTAPPETASGSGTGTGTGTAIAPAVRITALQYRAVRPADDYYPPQSLRLEEEGTAIVQVCVAPSGKLEGAPVIQESSGSPRLDEGALKWAREALRFTPATRDGVPVSACKGFRVNFRVH